MKTGDIDSLYDCVINYGKDPNQIDQDGRPVFFNLVDNYDSKLWDILVLAGVSVDKQDRVWKANMNCNNVQEYKHIKNIYFSSTKSYFLKS
jgi:hypothetical protein